MQNAQLKKNEKKLVFQQWDTADAEIKVTLLRTHS